MKSVRTVIGATIHILGYEIRLGLDVLKHRHKEL